MIAIATADPAEHHRPALRLAGHSRPGGSAGAALADPADEYEYQPLRLDPTTSRSAATTMLAVHAEYSGWELARVLMYSDGTRWVWLRRRRGAGLQPGLAV